MPRWRAAGTSLVIAGLTTGCASLQAAYGPLAATVAHQTPTASAAALAAAREATRVDLERCERERREPLALEAERSAGALAALADAQRLGPAFIELDPGVAHQPNLPLLLAEQQWRVGQGPRTDLHRALTLLVRGLATYTGRPLLPWTVVIIDSPTPFLSSYPGGLLLVTTSVLRTFGDEASLAGALAHEMGHITARHDWNRLVTARHSACTESLLRAGATSNLSAELRAMTGALAPTAREASASLSRTYVILRTQEGTPGDEFEADREAMTMLIFAGYDERPFQEWVRNRGGLGDQRVYEMRRFAAEALGGFEHPGSLVPALPPEFSALRP